MAQEALAFFSKFSPAFFNPHPISCYQLDSTGIKLPLGHSVFGSEIRPNEA